MITNEIPVTILLAYFSLPRHIRKGMLIRRIITSDLCAQLVASNFAKNQENFKGELCLNVITPFTISAVVLQLRDVPKRVIRVKQNGKVLAVVRGATAPLAPP